MTAARRRRLTTTEAAERLNLDPETLRRLTRAGDIPATRKTSATRSPYLYDEAALDAYQAGNAVTA